MPKKYPNYTYRKTRKFNRHWGGCKGCGQPVQMKSWCIEEVIQYNHMRGDDDVNCYHLECDPRATE